MRVPRRSAGQAAEGVQVVVEVGDVGEDAVVVVVDVVAAAGGAPAAAEDVEEVGQVRGIGEDAVIVEVDGVAGAGDARLVVAQGNEGGRRPNLKARVLDLDDLRVQDVQREVI